MAYRPRSRQPLTAPRRRLNRHEPERDQTDHAPAVPSAACRRACGFAVRSARPPSFARRRRAGSTSARSASYHFYLPARDRIAQLLDEDSFEEWFTDLTPCDPLGFKDRIPYAERSQAEQAKTGMRDAAVVGRGFIRGRPVVFGVTDFAFMAGSMGSVVGEKLTRAAEEATRLQLPLIFVSGSGGGARMQEGILSLMQMAKVSAALGRYDRAGGLYISILTNPTMGGVAASFALQGDITLAEPGALIGFAGKRTIWNTVRLELPEGFQTSEFLLQHGFVDRIVPRKDLRTEVARIIDYCEH